MSNEEKQEITDALNTLAKHIGIYGVRNDCPVAIQFGNGVCVFSGGYMVAGGIPNTVRWIEKFGIPGWQPARSSEDEG